MAVVNLGVYQILPLCNVATNIPTGGGLLNTVYQGRGFFMSIQGADLTSVTATGSFNDICKVSSISVYEQRPYKAGDLFFVQYGPMTSWATMVLGYTDISSVENYQLTQISLSPVGP